MNPSRLNWKSAIFAGIVATIIMTIVMALFGMNLMKTLGKAAGMEGGMIYFIGGLIHLCVGIVYALIYAWIVQPFLRKLPGFLAGAIYSVLLFIIAMIFMGPFIKGVQSVFNAQNPSMMCAPCHPCKSQMKCHPCYPNRQSRYDYSRPSCQPCRPTYHSNPCQPYGNQCGPCKSGSHPCKANPCNPCNPCAPNGGGLGWLYSLIVHLVYGVVLGWVYRPKETQSS